MRPYRERLSWIGAMPKHGPILAGEPSGAIRVDGERLLDLSNAN